MKGFVKIRMEMGLSQEEMASELCVTPKEYKEFEENVYSIPLPILKLSSLITHKSMNYLLSEVQ